MRRRLKKELNSDYKKEYSSHLGLIASINKLELRESFIVVSQDKNTYPKPDDIVALKSDDEIKYWADAYLDDDIDKSRYFNDSKATSKDGLNQPRYFAIMDDYVDGKCSVYDDQDVNHLVSDSVQVVDLYLYPSSNFNSTFKKDIDYSNEILAIKMEDIFEKEEILSLIETYRNNMPYERMLIVTHADVKAKISKLYKQRGLLRDSSTKTIRVKFEKCILMTDTLGEITPFSQMCLKSLRKKGFNIDIISSEYTLNKEVEKFLDDNEIEYDTFNNYTQFHYSIDTRNLMSYGVIDWDVVHKTLLNKSLFDVELELDDMSLDVGGDVENVIKKFSDFKASQFTYTLSDILTISKETHEALVSNGELHRIYHKDFPTDWNIIFNLQNIHQSGVEFKDIDDETKKLIENLGLVELYL